MLLLIKLILAAKIYCSLSKKILVLHPLSTQSHVYALRRLNEELVHRGHKVTVLRYYESDRMPQIDLPGIKEIILSINNTDGKLKYLSKDERGRFQFPMHHAWSYGTTPLELTLDAFYAVGAACETLLSNGLLLSSFRREKFDLAIVDIVANECGLALAHHLGLHAIGYWTIPLVGAEIQYTSSFISPAEMPHVYNPASNNMSFLGRAYNTFLELGSHLVMQVLFSFTNHHIQKHLPGTPHPADLLKNISGILINNDELINYPRQLPPSFVNVAGFHVRTPKPLPQDIQDFIDGPGKKRVILFSLGSMFDAHGFPDEVYESFFRIFAKLDEKIIVKSEKKPKFVSSNVRIYPFVPQNDILASNKTILFITHCGMHGVAETLYHGVPVVGIGIFMDQARICRNLAEREVGIAVDKFASEEHIYREIRRAISTTKYYENMKRLSKMYHNSLVVDPLKKAIWLIELVMETGGAEHLKLSSRNLNFIQYFCIDIYLLFLFVVSFSLYIFYKITSYSFKYMKSRNLCPKNKVD